MKYSTYTLLLFLLSIHPEGKTQQLDWIVPPVISDADEIYVHPMKNPMIRIEKDHKYGVKDRNDNTLIPPIHTELNISWDNEFVYLFSKNNHPTTILNIMGDTLDLPRSQVLKSPFKAHFIGNTQYGFRFLSILDKYASKNKFKLSGSDDGPYPRHYRILNKKNEVLIDGLTFSHSTYYLEEGFLIAWSNGHFDIYNPKGQLVDSLNFRERKLSSNGSGLFQFKNQLANKNFDILDTTQYEHLELIPGHDNYYSCSKNRSNKGCMLYDAKGKALLESPVRLIRIFDKNWLVLDHGEGRQIYDLKKKKVVAQFSYDVHLHSLNMVKGLIHLQVKKVGPICEWSF